MGYDINKFVDLSESRAKDLSCHICCRILNKGVVSHCGHTFCRQCVRKHIESNHNRCPKCRELFQRIRPESMRSGDNIVFISISGFYFKRNLRVHSIINKLKMKCDFQSKGCKVLVNLGQHQKHMKGCPYRSNKRAKLQKNNKKLVKDSTQENNVKVRQKMKKILAEEVSELHKKVEELNQKNTKQKKIIENLNQDNLDLKEKADKCKSQSKTRKKSLKQLKDNYKDFQNELKSKSDEIEAKNKSIEELKKNLKELKKCYDINEKDIKKLVNDLQLRENQLNLKSKENEENDSKLKEIENKLVENEELLQLIQTFKEDNIRFKNNEEINENKIQSLENQVNEWQTKCNEMIDKRRELEEELEKGINESNEWHKKYEELFDRNDWKLMYENREKQIKDLDKTVIELKANLESKETELKNIRKDRNDLSFNLNRIKDRLKEKDEELDKKDSEMEILEEAIDSVKRHRNDLILQLNDSKDLLEEKDNEMKSNLIELDQQKQQLAEDVERKINGLRVEFETREQSFKNTFEAIESLNIKNKLELDLKEEFFNTIINQSFDIALQSEVVLFGTYSCPAVKVSFRCDEMVFSSDHSFNFDIKLISIDEILFCFESTFPLIILGTIPKACNYIRRQIGMRSRSKGWYCSRSQNPFEKNIIMKLIPQSVSTNDWLSLIFFSFQMRPDLWCQSITAKEAKEVLDNILDN